MSKDNIIKLIQPGNVEDQLRAGLRVDPCLEGGKRINPWSGHFPNHASGSDRDPLEVTVLPRSASLTMVCSAKL